MSFEIELRNKDHGVAVTGVSFPERTIDVIVIPYETETRVLHGRPARWIREIVSRGAFGNIDSEHRPPVQVNREHALDRVIGRAIRFHPAREEGLVAELKISNTADGNDTLELAHDGLLDASAGFGVMDGGETWPEKGLRRLSRLWLDHIAMTSRAAYPDAKVLAVRGNQDRVAGPVESRPNLERIYGWRLEDRYAMMSQTTNT